MQMFGLNRKMLPAARRALLSSSLTALMLAGCAPPKAETDPNDAGVEVASVSLAAPAMQITTQAASLSARLARSGAPVELVKGDGPAPAAAAIGLRRIAEIRPPKLKGVKLQATDVFLAGPLAYVSYCRVGEAYGGGVQILDISQPQPRLLAEMTQPGADFYALTVSGDRLFVTGSSDHPALSSTAMLESLRLEDQGRRFGAWQGMVNLPSIAGTGLAADQDYVYALSGDRDGGLSRIRQDSLEISGHLPLKQASRVQVGDDGTGKPQVLLFRPGELQILAQDLQPRLSLPLSGNVGGADALMALKPGLAVLKADLDEALFLNLTSLETLRAKAGKELRIRPAATQAPGASAGLAGELVFLNEGRLGIGVASLGKGRFTLLGRIAHSSSSPLIRVQGCQVFMIDSQGSLNLLRHNYCQDSDSTLRGKGTQQAGKESGTYIDGMISRLDKSIQAVNSPKH